MRGGAVLVAIAASIGNFLQGWDNATIAGAIVYIEKDLNLNTNVEGIVVAMSLVGAVVVTTCSGAISDWVGRRPMLIMSSVLYFTSGLVMLWSPNVYVLLLARLLDGFGVGLAVTLVPLYISETAPSETRGLLNTFPQLSGSIALFLSYCVIFGMSFKDSPNWRLMLGIISIPSLVYFGFTVFFLPESPRWLVSKGRMLEAKQVLQRLRAKEDVSSEMALLVEGLGVGGETCIEEYIIGPDDSDGDGEQGRDHRIKFYGAEEGISWVAKPVGGESSSLGMVSRHGSLMNRSGSIPLMDPLVALFSSLHEKGSDAGGESMQFPNFGSMFSTTEPTIRRNKQWDEDSLQEGEGYTSETGGVGDYSDDNLQSPLLISRQTSSMEKGGGSVGPTTSSTSIMMQGHDGEAATSGQGIGGGWQLAWKWSEGEGGDGKKDGEFRRIYLHEEVSRDASAVEGSGEFAQVTALVSHSALYSKKVFAVSPVGPAMIHPAEDSVSKSHKWAILFEPGVKHALIVGIGIQILQQLSGMNGVMYYTPQIMEEAGVSGLLSDLGMSSNSASFLISAFTTLLTLPSIAIAMKLMDMTGRRHLLLTTIPVLVMSLVILVIGNVLSLGSVIHAVISTVCVIVYFCVFVMGFGPIPNILCAEIFPTKVRGLCIAICALFYWVGDILVTYTFPTLLSSIGLAGVFGIYAAMCAISWFFVLYKVPETKEMPLEVITEFFAVGAKQV